MTQYTTFTARTKRSQSVYIRTTNRYPNVTVGHVWIYRDWKNKKQVSGLISEDLRDFAAWLQVGIPGIAMHIRKFEVSA